MKKLSIVIPVFNKWNFTRSCLKDLSQLPEDHEIIIIDNASSDETKGEMIQIVRSLQMKNTLIYVRNEENVFHSKACNQGYALATSDKILFLNNDIRVKTNHTTWTQNIIDSCEDNMIVGPTMGLLDKGLNFVKEANQVLKGNSYIGGWCLAGNKKTLSRLDLGTNQIWSERYPMYFNDTDLSFRARKLGIKLSVVNIPDVVHFGKVSAVQLNINKLYNEGRSVFLKDWSK